MRAILLIIFCVLLVNLSYSFNPIESDNSILLKTYNNSETSLNKNYQQFKYQVVNFETNNSPNYANLKKRRKKNDKLMLYVAGGLAVATATLILTNDPENVTSNSTTGVNLGIAIGGTAACGMIVAKYFLDKRR